MDRDKKVGAVVMTVSVVLVFAVIAFSDGWYNQADFFRLLMTSLSIRMFKIEEGFDSYSIDIPTRYLALICLTGFSIGLLLYRNLIRLPNSRKENGENSDKREDNI